MDLNFGGRPKTKEMQVFEKMFMSAFVPLKNHIQYNNLQDKLTDDDLHMMAHALMGGLSQWCEFLRRAESESHRRNYGE